MKLCIADPPYLGRADRWYGDGRGSGRVRIRPGRSGYKPDYHPSAREWDDPERHVQLVADLAAGFDGWALAAAADSLPLLLSVTPHGTRVAPWVQTNAVPSGARVMGTWEPVLVFIPEPRRGRASGMRVRDALVQPTDRRGFLGSKPDAWTRWVLAMLGYDPSCDELTDLFTGSGAVAAAAAGMLPAVTP